MPADNRVVAKRTRRRDRQFLFAVAVMNAITGIGLVMAIGAANFGVDSGGFRTCAILLANGGDFCGSPYPPLFLLVVRPLTWLSPTAAMVTMTVIGGSILAAGVMLETRGRPSVDRALVAIAAVGFGPIPYELMLGQTTLLICAALYPVARRSDAFRNGVPLGIVLAVAPKPLLLPILVWMVVWRRRALTVVLVIAVMLTGFGLALLGSGQYGEWLGVITGAARESVAGTFSLSQRELGNYSLWPLTPATIVLAVVVAVATAWAILRDRQRGFVASLFAGLLLAPYSGLYAFSILLLAVKPALAFAPRATRALALSANLAGAPLHWLTAWSGLGLSACLTFKRRDEIAPLGEEP